MHLSKVNRFLKINGVSPNLQKILVTKRRSSNFKITQLRPNSDQLDEIKKTFFHNRSGLTTTDWESIIEILSKKYKHINRNNVDAIIVGICSDSKQLLLAKSYIKYLTKNGKQPNDATLGKLLRVYNAAYHARGGNNDSLTKEEQEEILDIYKQMKYKYEILDSVSCENLIYGLVATERWKDSLELLKMMSICSNAPSASAYTEIIIKAFATDDFLLGWRLMQQMLEQRKQPKCEMFLTLLNAILKRDLIHFNAEFEKFLNFLKTHEILITQKVVNLLQNIALEHPNLLQVTPSYVGYHGKCSNCGLYMKNVSLRDEDFKILQNSFLDKVLICNDVFQKSTPEEVKHFCDYVERTRPYDCVIDGLNVAYSMGNKKSTQAFANLLASVVKYFVEKNKSILVLGRNHMNNWPKKTMQFIKNNAAVFLANDVSQDDPFLLYATLKSGPSTDFFSRDLMRQHAFLLGPELKVTFRRWQQQHQYSLVTLTKSDKIIIKEPIRYLICAHKVQGTWHVPYKKEFSQHTSNSFEIPEQWLCLKCLK